MLQGFKEHLGNWLRDGFYYNKDRCDPVHIARTARFTRNANQFLHIPDCFDNEGILKLYSLRCKDSEFFGQDGYIRYDTVCLRCRGEKWTVYHPAELQVPENLLMLQPTPQRKMRSCLPDIWRWFRNIGRRRRGCMPKRAKEDELAIKKTMWRQPWLYWDSDKRMCRADDDAYTEEYKQKLLKDFDEKREYCKRYDDEKRAEAAWKDKKMAARAENWNTCFGRMKYRMLWWPQSFFHWLKGKGIHVGRWFKRVEKKTEANMANKSCQSKKENENLSTSDGSRSFLMGLLCCSKRRASDEEEADIPEETANNPPKKLTDSAVDEAIKLAEENAKVSSNEPAQTEESAHDHVNNGAQGTTAANTNDSERDVSAQTLVGPAEGTETCNSSATTALGDESSRAEQESTGDNNDSNNDGTVNKGSSSQNERKMDKPRKSV